MAGRPGAIEHHPERNAIHDAIMAHVPNRRISAQFGMGEASVRRYKDERLPPEIKAAYEREGAAACADLIADLREFYAMLKKLAREASETHDREAKHLLLKALAQAIPYTKAIGEARGDMAPPAGQAVQITNNVLQITYQQADDWRLAEPVAVIEIPSNGNGAGHDEDTCPGD